MIYRPIETAYETIVETSTAWRIYLALFIPTALFCFAYFPGEKGLFITDLKIWWVAWAVTTGLIPIIIWSYLAYPAVSQNQYLEHNIDRLSQAIDYASYTKEENNRELLSQFRMAAEDAKIHLNNLYHPSNYILPLSVLALILGVGFYIIFSRQLPLNGLGDLDDLILEVPTSVLYGFIGGTTYCLFSVINRYRTSDIPPGLILQLAFQIILASAVALFFDGEIGDMSLPAAFFVGFIPYRELTSYIRKKGKDKLGIETNDIEKIEEIKKTQIIGSIKDLDGINSSQRERLSEEQVFSLQNLATSNPLKLLLSTSYPIELLLDWIDQAKLHLFIGSADAHKLTKHGIRGVVDLASLRPLVDDENGEHEKFIAVLAKVLGVDVESFVNLIKKTYSSPDVKLLGIGKKEFLIS